MHACAFMSMCGSPRDMASNDACARAFVLDLCVAVCFVLFCFVCMCFRLLRFVLLYVQNNPGPINKTIYLRKSKMERPYN